MLPKPGIYYFPWEISDGQVPEGSTLRTFGRLYLYDMTRSLVTLVAPQKPDQCQLLVCTNLVEPFEAHVNFLYMVLGELERAEGGSLMVRARLLTCVEGMDLSLLEKAILDQRLHLKKRQEPIEDANTLQASPPAPQPLPSDSPSLEPEIKEEVPPPQTLD
ncbi:CST complex subunit TEN1 [Arvicanthis niloticus]|uniref:CST complex subunit TEN1 n=1 Tax=Arvicanthis niloticus TaxID=61156 RepID=UPI001486D554|nr:CST complex subunit TEN1 [Arvicanthis niloticus]XP_034360653.1 CST complex subunit TEN1 [Arvicanthis niloticus]